MKNIEVTVSIITYGQEKYIRQCLDSVFEQKTSFEFQVVVAEDCSPDNTRAILLEYKEKYGEKLVLILHDKNLGVTANSDSIVPFFKGKYIAVLEGDDCWIDDNKLQRQYDFLESHPEYSAVCSDYKLIDSDGNDVRNKVLELKTDIIMTTKNWLNEPYFLHTCTIFRRIEALPTGDARYIQLRKGIPTMGDLITFTFMYDYGPIYVFKEQMSAHRIAGKADVSSYSAQSTADPLKYTRLYFDIFSKLEVYFNHKYDFTKRRCLKLAHMKVGKLIGAYSYSASDMRKLEKEFSVKWRLYIFLMAFVELWTGFFRKIKRTLGKSNGQK